MPSASRRSNDGSSRNSSWPVGLAAVAFTLIYTAETTRTKPSGSAIGFDVVLHDSHEFELCNDYACAGANQNHPYAFARGVLFAEPHRPTRARVRSRSSGGEGATTEAGGASVLDATSGALAWTLHDGSLGALVAEASGDTETDLVFPGSGEYSLAIADASAAVLLRARVVCRYVRRELRELSETDREHFLDAIVALKTLPSDAADLSEYDTFVDAHLVLAGDRDTDQLHAGLGFLTRHQALTGAFEAALQRVDPRTAVPYWDFTRDRVAADLAVAADGARGADSAAWRALWNESVWNDDAGFGATFGSALHTVESGRFAYWAAATTRSRNATRNATGAATAAPGNAYGFLRAPWSMNRSPFLTRVHTVCGSAPDWEGAERGSGQKWPGCHEHRALTNATNWYDYAWAAQYAPHAPVHTLIGGVLCGSGGGEDDASMAALLPNVQASPSRRASAHHFLTYVPKLLWRERVLEYPAYCSAEGGSACHAVCGALARNRTALSALLRARRDALGATLVEDGLDDSEVRCRHVITFGSLSSSSNNHDG